MAAPVTPNDGINNIFAPTLTIKENIDMKRFISGRPRPAISLHKTRATAQSTVPGARSGELGSPDAADRSGGPSGLVFCTLQGIVSGADGYGPVRF